MYLNIQTNGEIFNKMYFMGQDNSTFLKSYFGYMLNLFCKITFKKKYISNYKSN